MAQRWTMAGCILNLKDNAGPRAARLCAVLPGVIFLLCSSLSVRAEPTVTITGGADETGHLYAWTITHDHTSPIVHVEFPHYMANFFTPPPGWSEHITHPVGEGGRAGKCTARVADPALGLKPGRPCRFEMRIAPDGAPRGEGDVLIRFADGVEVIVRAQVPVMESVGARNISLIGLGVIFGLFLLVRTIKRQRPKARPDAGSESTAPDPPAN